MGEQPNLELRRKACEAALGLTRFQNYGNGGGFYHRNGCTENARNSSCKCGGSWHLPAIESDPAVSEPLFLEWCEKNHFDFEMRRCLDNGWVRVHIYECGVRDDGSEWIEGATPSECRAKAIVAASAKEQK